MLNQSCLNLVIIWNKSFLNPNTLYKEGNPTFSWRVITEENGEKRNGKESDKNKSAKVFFLSFVNEENSGWLEKRLWSCQLTVMRKSKADEDISGANLFSLSRSALSPQPCHHTLRLPCHFGNDGLKDTPLRQCVCFVPGFVLRVLARGSAVNRACRGFAFGGILAKNRGSGSAQPLKGR